MDFLVKTGGGLGDLAMATPIFHAITSNGHNVSIITRSYNSELFADTEFINVIGKVHGRTNYISQFNVYRKLLKSNWDVTLNLFDNTAFNLFAFLSSAKINKSLEHTKDNYKYKSFLLHNLSILVGVIDNWQDNIQTTITFKPERYTNACQALSIDEKSSYLTIAPFTSQIVKDWSLDNFSIVLNKIAPKFDYIIITGSPSQIESCAQLAKSCNGINAAGKLSLLETAALVSNAKFHLSNDSGLGHIAAGNNTPVLAIGGHSVFKPWQQHQISGDVKNITPEQVLNKLNELI